MEIIEIKDPFATQEKKDKKSHMVHIFESNLPSDTKTAVSEDINVY